MKKLLLAALLYAPTASSAQDRPPLLSEPIVAALAKELSGERAHETIKAISGNHRMRGSRGFRAAAEIVAAKARAAGLEDVKIEEFPADGKIFYGTQRSRPPWDAEFAELWEITPGRERTLIASWEKMPMSLAQDSESGEAKAELVDVGAGSAESDYAGKNVRGKLILISSQPETAVPLGVTKYGAAGIVSYAQNQRTAWWGENTDLVRWGHLDTFSPTKSFAFMVSPKTAKEFNDRLARGERIDLDAKVRAGKHPGVYSIVTAAIRGADPKLSQEEIVFSCHLDHPNPGANDNASGCATILEVGVALAKLVKDGSVPRPGRTIRFVWPPEVEGTVTILNAKPDWAKRVKAAIHMDMVGAGLESKAVFHVSNGPGSLPSFVYDVGHAFGSWVNDQTYRYAARGTSKYPLVSPKGGKEPLLAQLDEFDMGSDHQDYTDASWGIPAIYLHDWPDRYIHTTWDTPERIDPTKLLRAAFIGAASGYFLATLTAKDSSALELVTYAGSQRRELNRIERITGLEYDDADNMRLYNNYYQQSIDALLNGVKEGKSEFAARYSTHMPLIKGDTEGERVYVRNPNLRGPMSVFGYDYLSDKLGLERVSKLRLLQHPGLWGSGGDYAYDVLNLARADMRVIDIRNAVSAMYGPVGLDLVLEYLTALEEARVVTQVR